MIAISDPSRACVLDADRAVEPEPDFGKRWYAIYTYPRNEKAARKYLSERAIESFLPTYEEERLWRNRQRVKISLPLFPCYLFGRIGIRDRATVLQSPGVIQVIGCPETALAVTDSEIAFLQSSCQRRAIRPAPEVAVGRKVRIGNGVMRGVEGVLVRSHKCMIVIRVEMINQHAAIEVNSEETELIPIE